MMRPEGLVSASYVPSGPKRHGLSRLAIVVALRRDIVFAIAPVKSINEAIYTMKLGSVRNRRGAYYRTISAEEILYSKCSL